MNHELNKFRDGATVAAKSASCRGLKLCLRSKHARQPHWPKSQGKVVDEAVVDESSISHLTILLLVTRSKLPGVASHKPLWRLCLQEPNVGFDVLVLGPGGTIYRRLSHVARGRSAGPS